MEAELNELEVEAPRLSPRRALATASAIEGCRELTTLVININLSDLKRYCRKEMDCKWQNQREVI